MFVSVAKEVKAKGCQDEMLKLVKLWNRFKVADNTDKLKITFSKRDSLKDKIAKLSKLSLKLEEYEGGFFDRYESDTLG